MRVIAVTGGIGSGKSTLVALYRSLGAQVVDADAVSRALTAPGGQALPALREAFGNTVFRPDGTLDRAALGKVVFGDPQALARLNGVMHPRIIARSLEMLAAARAGGAAATVLEAPLLFETGMDALADTVVCVTAPETVRVRRVCRRDGLTPEEALRRIRSQNPQEQNAQLSDYTLSTDAPYADTRRRALALWRRMMEEGPRRTPRGFNPPPQR